jgi:hypothetical protein
MVLEDETQTAIAEALPLSLVEFLNRLSIEENPA